MAGEIKGKFRKYDLATTSWIVYWFASVTSQVASDSTTRRYVTDTQLGLINSFVGAPSNGQVWIYNTTTSQWEPSSDFLRKANPSFTGIMVGAEIRSLEGGTDTKLKLLAQDTGLSTNALIELLRNGGLNISATGQISINPGTTLNLNGKKIVGLGAPTLTTDAATKEYVDNLIALGVRPVAAVKVASVANIAALSGLSTVDGYTLLTGDRILVKNQTTVSQNGIYTVSTVAWVKVAADSGVGALVFVENGTTQNDWMYYCQSANVWIDHSKFDTYLPGAGLAKTGSTFRIKNFATDGVYGVTDDMIAAGINPNKIASFASYDSQTDWTEFMSPTVAASLESRVGDLLSAIKNIRGTANFHTNNAQTILGAFKKNKVYIGTTAPAGTTEVPIVDGDIWIDTAA